MQTTSRFRNGFFFIDAAAAVGNNQQAVENFCSKRQRQHLCGAARRRGRWGIVRRKSSETLYNIFYSRKHVYPFPLRNQRRPIYAYMDEWIKSETKVFWGNKIKRIPRGSPEGVFCRRVYGSPWQRDVFCHPKKNQYNVRRALFIQPFRWNYYSSCKRRMIFFGFFFFLTWCFIPFLRDDDIVFDNKKKKTSVSGSSPISERARLSLSRPLPVPSAISTPAILIN